MNKQLIIGGLVAVLLAGWFGAALQPDVRVEVPAQNLGALTGPDIPYTYLNIGGIRREYRRTALATATTTPCALQSPAATSTILAVTLQVNTGTSTATTWTLATSTTAFATTTNLTNPFALASGAQGSMQYTGTTTASILAAETTNGYDILPPNAWVVWGVAGIGNPSDTTKLNGVCQAEFLVTS